MQEVFNEKDLFRGYEIRNWNFTPRIYKILAASVVFNLVAMGIFSQTNLLTQKGCDSPFVKTVCEVLDTVYVGNKLFGTDGDYVVKEYNKTELGVDDEVTFIDVSNMTPPIAYPAGYFAVANPEQYIIDENGLVVAKNAFENVTPGFPGIPNDMPSLMNSTPNLPSANNNPTTGKLPDSPWEVVNGTPSSNGKKGNRKNPTLNNDSPTTIPKLDGDETADTKDPKLDEKTATNSEPVKEVEVNKKPFQDLGKMVRTKWAIKPETADNKIDLKPFKVVLNAKLSKKEITDEDGDKREVVGFDKKSRFVDLPKEEAGDQAMVDLAKESIEAVGDSGFLGHLYNQGMKDLKITLVQKDDKIFVSVESVLLTEERAKTLSSGLNGLIGGAKLFVTGKDELFLLNSAQPPTNEGKKVIINIELGKDDIQQMILRKLAEDAKKEADKKKEADQKNQNPNNSTAHIVNSNQNTGK